MINANELRLKNLVWDTESHEIDEIDAIEETRIGLKNSIFPYTEITKVIEIKLTKEWLLKFGFTESNQLFVYKGDNFQVFIYPNISDDYFHFSMNQWLSVNVWYVHQLQNLIYTLFGVELQLSST